MTSMFIANAHSDPAITHEYLSRFVEPPLNHRFVASVVHMVLEGVTGRVRRWS